MVLRVSEANDTASEHTANDTANEMIERFKVIEHTADIGITVYGKTLKELFENAAYGMFSQMTDLEKVDPKEEIDVEIQAYDKESQLVNWLNELLYLSAIRRMLFSQFNVKSVGKNRVSGLVKGERIDRKKHSLHLEVKAATYHNLKIEETKEGYQTPIIFDV